MTPYRRLRFAYADPPYLGMSKLYPEHPEAAAWDDLESHRDLLRHLEADFDGWAFSLHVPSLRALLPLVSDDVRVCAWVKPFAVYKANVTQAWAWEPVFVRPLRPRLRSQATVPDYVSANITLQRGTVGAKPEGFAYWLFAFAGLAAGDEFHDLYPGSGAMSKAWERWSAQVPLEAAT